MRAEVRSFGGTPLHGNGEDGASSSDRGVQEGRLEVLDQLYQPDVGGRSTSRSRRSSANVSRILSASPGFVGLSPQDQRPIASSAHATAIRARSRAWGR